jgi:hypothetical protein
MSHLKRCGAWRLQDILYTEKEPRQRFASAATLSNEILHCKRDPSRCGNAFSMTRMPRSQVSSPPVIAVTLNLFQGPFFQKPFDHEAG